MKCKHKQNITPCSIKVFDKKKGKTKAYSLVSSAESRDAFKASVPRSLFTELGCRGFLHAYTQSSTEVWLGAGDHLTCRDVVKPTTSRT